MGLWSIDPQASGLATMSALHWVQQAGSPGLVIMVVWFQRERGKGISLLPRSGPTPSHYFQLWSIVKEMSPSLRLSRMGCKGTSYKSGFQGVNDWGWALFIVNLPQSVRWWKLFLILENIWDRVQKNIYIYTKLFNIINKNIRLGVVNLGILT